MMLKRHPMSNLMSESDGHGAKKAALFKKCIDWMCLYSRPIAVVWNRGKQSNRLRKKKMREKKKKKLVN